MPGRRKGQWWRQGLQTPCEGEKSRIGAKNHGLEREGREEPGNLGRQAYGIHVIMIVTMHARYLPFKATADLAPLAARAQKAGGNFRSPMQLFWRFC